MHITSQSTSHALAAVSVGGVISGFMHYLPVISLVLSSLAAFLSIVITISNWFSTWLQGRAKIAAIKVATDAETVQQALKTGAETASTVEQQAQVVQAAVDTIQKKT